MEEITSEELARLQEKASNYDILKPKYKALKMHYEKIINDLDKDVNRLTRELKELKGDESIKLL